MKFWSTEMTLTVIIFDTGGLLKFRYSEKETTFWKISPIFDDIRSSVKKLGDFFQIFVAYSEYLNFNEVSKMRIFIPAFHHLILFI